MGWNAHDIPDLTNRVAVVTGANSGLGLESARELARAGAKVFMAARNTDRAKAARQDILADLPDAELDVIELDLASLRSVRSATSALAGATERLDILINNAGVMGIPRRLTEDGFEMQLGTNHFGHFALTALLSDLLRSADAARVVTVTSTGRNYAARLDPEDLSMEGSYDPWRAYGRSKRANFHFALALHRRLEESGSSVASLAAHPGFSNTNLQASSLEESRGGSQRFFHEAVRRVGMAPDEGALSQLRAATDPGASSGEFYTPRWVNFGPPERRPFLSFSARPSDLDLLWDVSEQATGITFDVA
jgi:NAD(P)-dependent dehydrogenase (short-subunit alcohol dehydrogenase family)